MWKNPIKPTIFYGFKKLFGCEQPLEYNGIQPINHLMASNNRLVDSTLSPTAALSTVKVWKLCDWQATITIWSAANFEASQKCLPFSSEQFPERKKKKELRRVSSIVSVCHWDVQKNLLRSFKQNSSLTSRFASRYGTRSSLRSC